METYRPQVGSTIEDLDTPCLLIDLDALEHNFAVVSDTYRDTECKMRPHTKNTKSPLLAHMQIQAGGTNGGICTAKVSEAEVMVEGGITDILIPNQIVTADKIDRLCSIARRAEITVAIDNEQNVRDISNIATAKHVTIGLVIEIDTQMGRAGIRHNEQGVRLARLASKLPGVRFKGVMCHQGATGISGKETRFTEGRRFLEMALDVKNAIEADGIPVQVVSAAETWTYDVAPTVPGITEVEGGTYALMMHTLGFMDDFQVAAKVLSTVISTPRDGVAVGDVGHRALGYPNGMLPRFDPGLMEEGLNLVIEGLQEHHILMRSEGEMNLKVGDKFLLQSGQQDILTNRWDHYIAVREGVVEGVWPITGRGCHN